MFPVIIAALATCQDLPKTWYGPATATFAVQFAGNPYDPAENDVHVVFLGEKGQKEDRLAYFDSEESAWKAVLVSKQPGTYRAELVRNGSPTQETAKEGYLELKNPLAKGFVELDPKHSNRFRFSDGTPYYPIGFNMAWDGSVPLPVDEQILKSGKVGVNWSRVWACHWGGKNPWWPKEGEVDKGQFWEPALTSWDKVVDASTKAGVRFQMVMFHHGQFSTKVNPNWQDNPMNEAKGGFLKDPADFFTDKRAKELAKKWLRYAVARYSSSPNVLAWELFNEVEWVDARYNNRWADIESWHKEMAEYLRSIDPYQHLITTSSEQRPGLLGVVDYAQPHTYPPSIRLAVGGFAVQRDKPTFFGEFGPADLERDDSRAALRDGVYAAMLANHAGTAMFWQWDAVEKKDLYGEYATASQILEASQLAKHADAKPIKVKVLTEQKSDLTFGPGLGWAASTQVKFNLPEDALGTAFSGLSSYIQGKSHPEMMPGPIQFQIESGEAGEFRMHVSGSSKGGGHLQVRLNGALVKEKVFPAGATESKAQEDWVFPIAKGSTKVLIENIGDDWVSVDRYVVTKLAPQATASVLSESDWMMSRITTREGFKLGEDVTLRGIPLADAEYDVDVFDLDTGKKSRMIQAIHDFSFTLGMPCKDAVLVFRRKS